MRCKNLLIELIDLTVLLLELLVKEYELGNIDLDDFQSHTSRKVQFLREHLVHFQQSNRGTSIENVIKLCSEITG